MKANDVEYTNGVAAVEAAVVAAAVTVTYDNDGSRRRLRRRLRRRDRNWLDETGLPVGVVVRAPRVIATANHTLLSPHAHRRRIKVKNKGQSTESNGVFECEW